MDVLQAILTRRSIRRFTGQPVSEGDLETLLRAASQAPSAHNRQPWHFIVVRDKKSLESIAEFHPYAKMLPRAGCGIVVCGDSVLQKCTGFLVADCSAAIQNILLAAHGIGLGAVWCGLYPREGLTRPISELFGLPENIIPVGVVAVGHGDEQKDPADRYDKSKIHTERW
ncbi:MAG: nitroreductase family protein [Clostridia bacterium]|nr:nitroreductase family protein [Clostridiales bacterium]